MLRLFSGYTLMTVAMLCGLDGTPALAQQIDFSTPRTRADTVVWKHPVGAERHAPVSWRNHYDASAGQPPALLVLDGVPHPDLLGSARRTIYGTVGIENIDSVEILRGPAALRSYGEDARGGAILIRTRRTPARRDHNISDGTTWFHQPGVVDRGLCLEASRVVSRN
jgi:hypothetical protein